MKRNAVICLLAGGLSIVAGQSMAESGIYFGTGFSYRSMSAHRFKDEKRYVQRKRIAHDMVLGFRTDSGNAFYGPEINVERFLRGNFPDRLYQQDCAVVQDTSFYCSRRSTYRLRGIYGRKVGRRLETYVALGIGVMKGYGARHHGKTSLGINAGISLGLGMQVALGNRGMLRGEVTHDRFNMVMKHPDGPDGIRYSPSYEATTIKISYIYAF